MFRLSEILILFSIIIFLNLISTQINAQNQIKLTVRQIQKYLLQEYINKSVNPCENIIEFSCGKWNISEYKTNNQYSKLNRDDYLIEALYDQKIYEIYPDDHPAIKAREYYESCLNIPDLKRKGWKPLINFAKTLFHIPEFYPNDKNAKYDWIKIHANLRLYSLYDIIFETYVLPDYRNSSVSRLYFEKPYLSEICVPCNVIIIQNLLQDININASITNEIAVNVCEFVEKLQNLTQQVPKLSVELFESITINKLNKIYYNLGLERYITQIRNRSLNSNEIVYVHHNYFKNLNNLISQTSNRTLIFHLLINFIYEFKYFTIRSDKIEFTIDQWFNNCLQYTKRYMNMAIANIFTKKYLNIEKEIDIKFMIKNLRQKSIEILLQNTWMDIKTKMKIFRKLQYLSIEFGYSSFVKNYYKLKEWYSEVKFDRNKFFETTMDLHRLKTRKELDLIGHYKYDNNILMIESTDFNMFYIFQNNKAIISPNFLLLPQFHEDFPDYLKYGLVGVAIAHEISHSLDTNSIKFDENGNFNDEYKKTNDFKKEYKKRTQCFVNQYNNLGSNGTRTLNENIADNGGLKISYLAYMNWIKNHKNLKNHEIINNNLNLTNKQLFFVSYVQQFCKDYFIRQINYTAVHAEPKARIEGTLMNSEYFAEAFNCNPDDRLNPQDKCSLI